MGNVQGKKGKKLRSADGGQSNTSTGTSTPKFDFEAYAAAKETFRDFGEARWAQGEDWLTEFAVAASTPEPYKAYKDEGNAIEETGFGGEDGIITARSLLMDRQSSFEYAHDNYMSCLGLSHEELLQLGQAHAKLLDVGAGDSIFPAEASLFGITVKGTDFHATNDVSRRQKVFNQYAKGHLFAECVKRYKGMEPTCSVGQPAMRAICVNSLRQTESRYLENPPITADCTNLKQAFPEDSQFDGVVSAFLLMYLPHKASLEALKEMVRVTKSGGWIRIFEGDPWADEGTGLPPGKLKVDGIVEVPQKKGSLLRVFMVQKKDHS